ncbi:hypothetical protein GCM10022286_28240 [Gryllotalpicola daejeonensis]|uniref:Uncharacterized protein n=1 Tax=Gryllotalpicola daejeonensis TaxID=993087 RepID=A0ABP7ZN22_9MICO
MSHVAPRPKPVVESVPSVDRLSYGLNLAANIVLGLCFLFFIADITFVAVLPLTISAWVILIVVVTLTQLGTARRLQLPKNWFTYARIAFAVVLVLDVFGVLDKVGENGWGPFPTAAMATGAGLAMFATTERARALNLAATALGILLIVDIMFTTHPSSAGEFAPGIVSVAIAVTPPIVAVAIVNSFRNMVEFQSDLSQAKGTTSGAGISLGLSASEQLVRLDAQAEKLLDDVASGRTPLPLPDEIAEEASTIATQLRMNLVAGKSETWLYHALTESSVLGSISTIDDPDGLAAGLAPDQRDGLLTAIWMFAGDGERVAQSLTVTVRRSSGAAGQNQRLAITLELIGVPKRRIDPAAWQAISRVGRYSDSFQTPTLRIDVDCALDVVADR